MKTYPEENLNDLGKALEALTTTIKPLYDDLSFNFTTKDQIEVELRQVLMECLQEEEEKKIESKRKKESYMNVF